MKRRDLLKGAVATIPGALGLQLLHAKWAIAQTGDFNGPLDVLNYALVLEYLEAEYYRQGVAANLLSGVEAEYLANIASDEVTHVAALTSTITQLGGEPAPSPAVDFGESFSSREQMLETAYRFENSCMQGYLGAGAHIFGEKQLVAVALSIYGVEARHAALIGLMAGKPAAGGVFKGPVETPYTRQQVYDDVGGFFTEPGVVSGRAARTT
jgi:hypothetical protein